MCIVAHTVIPAGVSYVVSLDGLYMLPLYAKAGRELARAAVRGTPLFVPEIDWIIW